MNRLKNLYNVISGLPSLLEKNRKEIESLKLLTAKGLIKQAQEANSIHEAEFQVFSQWGDDGIIQYLINNIPIENKVFVEFGVENYTEANTRFLLINNNWMGLVIDGSDENVNYIKNDDIYWRNNLVAKASFITAENIDSIIEGEGIRGKIGLLHIDIDGNDYWIWKKISVVDADIVIVEFNSLFGDDRSITVPYNPDFQRYLTHYSNLYYGVSLPALCDLAEEKGYVFVGCNSAGNNAYFVKKEKAGQLKKYTAKEGYVQSGFKESRDENGNLTFKMGAKRAEIIKGLEVINTRTNLVEKL